MCNGALGDGSLRNITEIEVQARCSADESCVGYVYGNAADGSTIAIPMVGWWNLFKVQPGWRSFVKQDNCLVDADADKLAKAMASFADELWPIIARHHGDKLIGAMTRMQKFAEAKLPPETAQLPVFYPFS